MFPVAHIAKHYSFASDIDSSLYLHHTVYWMF